MSLNSVTEAYRLLAEFTPNPMQEEVWERLETDGGLLVEGPTGSGKTEAVAVPGLAREQRTFVILPARSLVDDQIGRFAKMLCRASQLRRDRPYALVVDTGAASVRRVWCNGEETPQQERRHLYQGDIIVTTLDKFLYRFFGFGEPGKSYIFPFRIQQGLRRTLFCFDEAHTYDNVAWSNFRLLVRALYEKGRDVVVMSATMPGDFKMDLKFLTSVSWVSDEQRARLDAVRPRSHPQRHFSYVPVAADALLDTIADAVRTHHAAGRRIIVTLETVKAAAALFRRLQKQGLPNLFLYHGRLADQQRAAVYRQIKERDEQGSYLLVTTSAIEVGCDLNAHTLITQLCNPEQLLQRIGRCNRRGDLADAHVVVVGQEISDYLRTLPDDKLTPYLQALQQMDGSLVKAGAIQHCITKQPNPDYRIEIAFDMLYEYVYEAQTVNKKLHDNGLVVTRSWEPTITLCTSLREDNEPVNPVQVSLRRCVASSDDTLIPVAACFLRTFGYQGQERRPRLEPLGPGWRCAYFSDLIVQVPAENYEPTLGYVDLPDIARYGGQHGYHQRLFVPLKDDKKAWFWYIAPLEHTPSSTPDSGEDESEEDNGDEE